MIEATYNYPGDPPQQVQLIFGMDFQKLRGPGKLLFKSIDPTTGKETVSSVFEFDEVICDVCNKEVLQYDPCALTQDRLYCWDCSKEYVMKYLDIKTIKNSNTDSRAA